MIQPRKRKDLIKSEGNITAFRKNARRRVYLFRLLTELAMVRDLRGKNARKKASVLKGTRVSSTFLTKQMPTKSRVSEKSIVITGASSGIGEALALHYAAPHVVLGLTGRDATRLEAVAGACRAKGAKVEPMVLDVSNRSAMFTWLEAFDDKHPIDLLIANAGVGGGGAKVPTAESFESTRHMFAVNIGGVCNTIDPILPRMAKRGFGQAALVASLAGYRGLAGAPAYSASKGFVKLYGEGLRGAMAAYGIRINVICPGFVESRITAQNNFKMPFFMAAPKAAKIIASGLQKNKARIAFPAPMAFMLWLFAALPVCVSEWIVNKLPQKN